MTTLLSLFLVLLLQYSPNIMSATTGLAHDVHAPRNNTKSCYRFLSLFNFKRKDRVLPSIANLQLEGRHCKSRSNVSLLVWDYKGGGIGSILMSAIIFLGHAQHYNLTLYELPRNDPRTLHHNATIKFINPKICPAQRWDCYFDPIISSECDPSLHSTFDNQLFMTKMPDQQVYFPPLDLWVPYMKFFFRPKPFFLDYVCRQFQWLIDEIGDSNPYFSVQLRTGHRFMRDSRNGRLPTLKKYINDSIVVARVMKLRTVVVTTDHYALLPSYISSLNAAGISVHYINETFFRTHLAREGVLVEDFIPEYYQTSDDTTWDYLLQMMAELMFLSRGRFLLKGESGYGILAAAMGHPSLISRICMQELMHGVALDMEKLDACAKIWRAH